MTLKLYNTLNQTLEVFKPQLADKVTFYVCGPTVYNFIHIGNARPAVIFDVLFRTLKNLYPKVVYVRNITDIDDKILAAATTEKTSIDQITQRYTQAYRADMQALNILAPTVEPLATDHIPEIIAMIEQLLSNGHAYTTDCNHVLFDVTSYDRYGQLSNRTLAELQAGVRVEVADYKRHPADFVLWKPSSKEQPGWDSPWGRGRPGWHIECSAMIKKHLGETIDLHGGGQDLIFPHHENEIAQSECCCTNKPFVRYWLHNGYITLNEEKMSKSLGNFVTVRQLLEQHKGEVIRYALLSSHYRSPLNWNDEQLTQAKNNLDRLYQTLRDAEQKVQAQTPNPTQVHTLTQATVAPILEDLNTPQTLTHLHQLAHQLCTASDKEKPLYATVLKHCGNWLGLLAQNPEHYFQSYNDASNTIDTSWIETKIQERLQARQNKNYQKADTIRNELLSQGIELEDTATGTRWRYLGTSTK